MAAQSPLMNQTSMMIISCNGAAICVPSSAHRQYLVQTKPCHTDGIWGVGIIQLLVETNINFLSSMHPRLPAEGAGRAGE